MKIIARKPTVIILIVSLLLPGIAAAADVEIESEPTGEKVYAGVKLLGSTPILLKDYRSGPITLRLTDGDLYEIDIPEGEATVKVTLNREVEDKPGFFETGGRWFLIGGIAAGVVALAILVLKPETTTEQPQ
ncbi:MAG: hypothetical protein GY771_00410 [bacterium]|nr:hypothetical protein [bacterium]